MVESTGLENRRPFTRSKGSNPFPSAISWFDSVVGAFALTLVVAGLCAGLYRIERPGYKR